jgi:hypothetical protein
VRDHFLDAADQALAAIFFDTADQPLRTVRSGASWMAFEVEHRSALSPGGHVGRRARNWRANRRFAESEGEPSSPNENPITRINGLRQTGNPGPNRSQCSGATNGSRVSNSRPQHHLGRHPRPTWSEFEMISRALCESHVVKCCRWASTERRSDAPRCTDDLYDSHEAERIDDGEWRREVRVSVHGGQGGAVSSRGCRCRSTVSWLVLHNGLNCRSGRA